MTFDLRPILESKRVHRRQLAALSIGEKLRILDALRERELAIRARSVDSDSTDDTDADPARRRSTPE